MECQEFQELYRSLVVRAEKELEIGLEQGDKLLLKHCLKEAYAAKPKNQAVEAALSSYNAKFCVV